MTAEAAKRHCVVMPFYNRLSMVARSLDLLLRYAFESTRILIVDDGSAPPASEDAALRYLLRDERVTLVRHDGNRGVSAARNTAIRWCREAGIEVVLMLDSDCEPSPDFLPEHLRLHRLHPEAAGISGGIEAVGKSFWAKLDGVTSWVHHLPKGPGRPVRSPYHVGCANLSIKMAQLPDRDLVFNELLRTGEDALFVREMHRLGRPILLCDTPRVRHRDRETLRGLLLRHYQYGNHQYFVQLGNDFSERCFRLRYRIPFVVLFLPALPLYALACSLLNAWPWVRHRPRNLVYYPLILLLWLMKGFAVLESAVRPWSVLRAPQPQAAPALRV